MLTVRFWYISFPSLHDLDVKIPYATLCGGLYYTKKYFFLFLNLRSVPKVIQLQENLLSFDILIKLLNKGDFILVKRFLLPSSPSLLRLPFFMEYASHFSFQVVFTTLTSFSHVGIS